MRFDVLTLFPEIFSGYLTQSLLKLAIDRGLTSVHLHNLRDWATGRHRQVDDKPFGGGPGMLLMPGPVVEAVEAVQGLGDAAIEGGSGSPVGPGRLLLMTPQGRRLDQPFVEDLATSKRIVMLCGRYEGFDQRVVDLLQPEEVSIGDYVLNGGEVAAMTIIDAVVRLVPGVLGDETSSQEDSFSRAGRTLEYAQYTRPREYRGLEVPEVLLSGNHPEIAAWREADALRRTAARRDDRG
jgi:tRNA (guanine37-N1)-methyltransferase